MPPTPDSSSAARSRESYTAFLEGTVLDAFEGAHDEGARAFRAIPEWMRPWLQRSANSPE